MNFLEVIEIHLTTSAQYGGGVYSAENVAYGETTVPPTDGGLLPDGLPATGALAVGAVLGIMAFAGYYFWQKIRLHKGTPTSFDSSV